ncbi:MAG: hypothetical protein V1746_00480 [bacterium]
MSKAEIQEQAEGFVKQWKLIRDKKGGEEEYLAWRQIFVHANESEENRRFYTEKIEDARGRFSVLLNKEASRAERDAVLEFSTTPWGLLFDTLRLLENELRASLGYDLDPAEKSCNISRDRRHFLSVAARAHWWPENLSEKALENVAQFLSLYSEGKKIRKETFGVSLNKLKKVYKKTLWSKREGTKLVEAPEEALGGDGILSRRGRGDVPKD